MDKLDLDARMTRLERRMGRLSTVLLLLVGLGVFYTIGRFVVRERSREEATAILVPPIPSPPPAPPAMPPMAIPASTSMDMMGFMGGMDGSTPTLQQRLTSLKQLHDEGLITEQEWTAMKAQLLEGPLTSGDLRSELQAIQQMFDDGLISDAERAALRVKLLKVGQ